MNNFIKYPKNLVELQSLSGASSINGIYLLGMPKQEPNVDELFKGIITKVFAVEYIFDEQSKGSTAIFNIGKEALNYDFNITLDSRDIHKPTLVKFNIIDQKQEEPTLIEVTPDTYTDQDPSWYITYQNGVFAVSVPINE